MVAALSGLRFCRGGAHAFEHGAPASQGPFLLPLPAIVRVSQVG